MSAHINFSDWLAVQQLYADYASALDAGEWERWPEFFTADGVYRLQPRENHERGFPLATLALTSQAMMKDRVYGIRETLFHDPYYQRHIFSAPRLRRHEPAGQADESSKAIPSALGERWFCESNYAVFRTKLSEPSTVFNVGRTLDVLVRTAEGWKFARREVIYDSEMIPNSIIYPV